MSDIPQDLQQPTYVRSTDFRYLPCDSFNLAISDGGVRLILGVNQLDGSVYELAGVHMTNTTAAALTSMLQAALIDFEAQSGNKITPPNAISK